MIWKLVKEELPEQAKDVLLFDGGQIYFTGSQYSGSTVAATGCVKDFNIYLNNYTEEELLNLVFSKFSLNHFPK